MVVLAGTIISYKESNGSLNDTPTIPAANFEWFVDEIIVETFLVPLIVRGAHLEPRLPRG